MTGTEQPEGKMFNIAVKSWINSTLKMKLKEDDLPSNITYDVAEDIVSDAVLQVITDGMPPSLRRLVDAMYDKHVTFYVERCGYSIENLRRNEFGENKATHVIDESSIPLEERLIIVD